MSNKDSGGPAFPCALGWIETDMNSGAQTSVDVRDVCHGMSLRDYFAAQALHGICAHADTWGLTTSPKIAHQAYELADAMLFARGEA